MYVECPNIVQHLVCFVHFFNVDYSADPDSGPIREERREKKEQNKTINWCLIGTNPIYPRKKRNLHVLIVVWNVVSVIIAACTAAEFILILVVVGVRVAAAVVVRIIVV